jgi:DNA-binding HxlR family transcriptional regulator
MPRFGPPTQEQIDKTQALYARQPLPPPGCEPDPRVETLVEDLIGRVADKWTMFVLEVLVEHGELRFTRLSKLVSGISQKMLTQTLRQMERDGLLTRKVHPVIPPKVEYKVTDLGLTLSAAFCGVWVWAAENLYRIEAVRSQFDKSASQPAT